MKITFLITIAIAIVIAVPGRSISFSMIVIKTHESLRKSTFQQYIMAFVTLNQQLLFPYFALNNKYFEMNISTISINFMSF